MRTACSEVSLPLRRVGGGRVAGLGDGASRGRRLESVRTALEFLGDLRMAGPPPRNTIPMPSGKKNGWEGLSQRGSGHELKDGKLSDR